MEILFWDRDEWWSDKHSIYELIRVHNEDHRRDKFSKVISKYPYWEETFERTVKALMHRTDYEFFLARLPASKEIVGWIVISFVSEGHETIGRHKFEARLEWTEMYSNILQTWKIESSGGKGNVWDENQASVFQSTGQTYASQSLHDQRSHLIQSWTIRCYGHRECIA